MKRLAIVVLAMISTSACFSSGVQVNPDQVASFQKGRTTYSDVIAALGQPTSQSISADGNRQISYMYVEAKARPETFIPIVGAFVGGADSKTSFATFRFDEKGILSDYSSTTGQNGLGTGLESGASVGRIPNEPRQAPSN